VASASQARLEREVECSEGGTRDVVRKSATSDRSDGNKVVLEERQVRD